jgi:hypothetical protein
MEKLTESVAMLKRTKSIGLIFSAVSIVVFVSIAWAAHEWPRWAGSDSSTLLLYMSILLLAASARLLVLGKKKVASRAAGAFLYSLILCAIAEAYQTVVGLTAKPEFEGPEVGLIALQIYVTLPVVILSVLFSLVPLFESRKTATNSFDVETQSDKSDNGGVS